MVICNKHEGNVTLKMFIVSFRNGNRVGTFILTYIMESMIAV